VCERSASHVAAYGAETCGRARQCGIRQSGTPSCIIILRMVYYYGILNGILSYIMHHGIPSCIMVYHKWYPEWYDDGTMHFGIPSCMVYYHASCIMVYHKWYYEWYDDVIMHFGITNGFLNGMMMVSCIMVYHKWYPEWYDDGTMHHGISQCYPEWYTIIHHASWYTIMHHGIPSCISAACCYPNTS